MNREGHDGVTMFIGTEVEHTPAFQQKTLFVVGLHPWEEIDKMLNDPYTSIGQQPITHIYFGANQSFPKLSVNDADEWREWEDMIVECLENNFLCTLDLDVAQVEGLVEGRLVEYRNFIPQISVKLPYLQQLGYNATIKLDDKDFKATNPGVWCHNLHDLLKRDRFTDWDKYGNDEILK